MSLKMKKINQHIEIVSSTVKSLSSMSERSRLAVQKSLAQSYETVGISIVNNESDLEALLTKNPDMVFLGMNYIPRQSSINNRERFTWLTKALHKNNICFTGSNYEASVLEIDKLKAKKVIKKAGLNTASFFMAYTGQFTGESQVPLPFPLFIKPPCLGGGAGIDSKSVVNDYLEYKAKIASLENDFDSEALVETYLTGREFTVAILKNDFNDDYQVMPLELKAPQNSSGDTIIGHEVKSSDSEKAGVVSDPAIAENVSALALECFKALGAKDYGRIDIRCDADGTAYFLEANLIPSLIENFGNFQKACQLNTSMTYDDMLLQIVALGFKNHIPYEEPVIEEKILEAAAVK